MGKDLNGKELGTGLFQRKDGRYEGRACANGIKIDIVDKSLPKLKVRFAEEKAKLLRHEKSVRPKETLEMWYDEWFERSKKPTLKGGIAANKYDSKAKNTYIRILGKKLIKDITQIDVQEATNQLTEEGYIDRTVSAALSTLKQCMDAAVVNNLVSFNPCVGINIKKGRPIAERRVLEYWEQDLLIDAVKTTPYEEAYMVLLLTGMRIGEFSGLQWNDIDFEKKEIHIERSLSVGYVYSVKTKELTLPKTTSGVRIIPFFSGVDKYLLSWQKKQQAWKKRLGKRWRCPEELGDLVFTTTFGSPLSKYPLANATKTVIKNMQIQENLNAANEGREPRKVEHIYPHAFRHTFATRCFENNLDTLFVQKIMGHSNYSTTLSYTHMLESKKQYEISKGYDLLGIKTKENAKTIRLQDYNEHLYSGYQPSSAF
nr:tyrosine-type recombinase/integrase [Eubacteriales bacterium]